MYELEVNGDKLKIDVIYYQLHDKNDGEGLKRVEKKTIGEG